MKKCKNKDCRKEFKGRGRVCSYPCAIALVRQEREERIAKQERKAKKETRDRLKTKSDWLKEAQAIFNKFIRLRDEKEPCISCRRTNAEVQKNDGWIVGGAWDCGHFLGRGAYPELRFEELNAHKQCKKCNGGSGKYAKKNRTVSQTYRIKLIKKIGIEKVEWLEGPHDPKKYTIPEIIEIKEKYKTKIKDMRHT